MTVLRYSNGRVSALDESRRSMAALIYRWQRADARPETVRFQQAYYVATIIAAQQSGRRFVGWN